MKNKKQAFAQLTSDWDHYIKMCREQNPEVFRTGDIEGYRRGYSDGAEAEEQRKIDLTLAGSAIISVISLAVGFTVGFAIAAAL